MFNRRSLLETFSALAAGTAIGTKNAAAAGVPRLPDEMDPRGEVGRLRRLPTVDLESKHQFLSDMTAWVNGDLTKAARARIASLAAAAGHAPDRDLPVETAQNLFDRDPTVAVRTRMWNSVHNYNHVMLDDAFHANAEAYLKELDAADKVGPGKLELSPGLDLPEYTRYEIHQQPGGYVGNAFAGHVYHYGTNVFYGGSNNQDERHKAYAAECPSPADGKVRRILDIGTGIGQLATAMKERFPDAQVYGIDAAAPMLRYAHLRAARIGIDVNFSQQLAEHLQYPDGHFDIVISYILFHEVTGKTTPKIFAEASRVLRPGGIFFPIDFNHAVSPSPGRLYWSWLDHRWNTEPWRIQWAEVDVGAELKRVGFAVDDRSKPGEALGKIIATKIT